jgi:diacylglycerol kinase (ATP)
MEKKSNKLVDSFNYAIEGFIYVLRSQRNMRLHFLFSILLLLVGIYLNLSGVELLILLIAIALVLFAEMLNTAIELTVDLISNTVNPLARIIKDISAGAVLLVSVSGLVVCYVIFSHHLNMPFDTAVIKIKQSPWHMTFIALILVLSIVIAGKVILHRGTPFRGGMPSGHAAFVFTIWTAILFSTSNDFIIILSFILAFLVARSRVTTAIHNIWEVVSGAAIGVLATTVVFQILK